MTYHEIASKTYLVKNPPESGKLIRRVAWLILSLAVVTTAAALIYGAVE